MTLVSIIIPIYQSHASIARCIDSFLAQNFMGDMEILCVGDPLEDPCHAVVADFAKRYPGKVQLHIQKGRGQGGARNLGLFLAQGEYIMFADADDYVEPNIIDTCLLALHEHNADFACVGFDRVAVAGHRYCRDQALTNNTVVDITPSTVAALAFVYPAPWGKLFKRELIGDTRFPENPLSAYEDAIFFLSLAPKIHRYVLLPDILYHYVVHETSSITNASLAKTQLFRSDLVTLKENFFKANVFTRCEPLLNLAAFIHVGIADVHRMPKSPELSLVKFCAGVKVFLDTSFPGWRNIPLKPYGKFTLRCLAVYIFKYMYFLGIFPIFIRCYNFLIKHLRMDIKW